MKSSIRAKETGGVELPLGTKWLLVSFWQNLEGCYHCFKLRVFALPSLRYEIPSCDNQSGDLIWSLAILWFLI